MNAIETILSALNIDLADAHSGVAEYTEAVTVALNEDGESITVCNAEGYPVARVGGEDVEYILGRVRDEDGLRWLHEWGQAGGWDVQAL